MPALVGESAFVTRFIRKLRGGSQPILVEASDGFTYVLKFNNNPQGRNVLFNEALGTELYRTAGLPVPNWAQLNVTEDFLNKNPRSWFEVAGSLLRPDAGLCFGSRYLGRADVRLWEILPSSSFSKIANLRDFYLALLLDVCALHSDNRQVLFVEHHKSLHAVFIDHGNMFSGPDGNSGQLKSHVPAYLDMRIYRHPPADSDVEIAESVLRIDVDKLWRMAGELPIEWLTDSALKNFAVFLNSLASAKAVCSAAELAADLLVEKDERESLPDERGPSCPNWFLRAGIQGA